MSDAERFFDDPPRLESLAKIDIVSDFFSAWLNIIGRTAKYTGPLAYLELFAGAGKYKDGTKSTPILVLEEILASPSARRFEYVVLNEGDNRVADRLEAAVGALNLSRLPRPPVLLREVVDSKNAVTFLDEIADDIPAVLFIDPFGYIGLTRELFARYIRKGWGRDAIFFFNYTRVNAALSNPLFEEHMSATFGSDRALALRATLANKSQQKREELIRAAIEDSLREI
jgi:three-Cys-motif partner protein